MWKINLIGLRNEKMVFCICIMPWDSSWLFPWTKKTPHWLDDEMNLHTSWRSAKQEWRSFSILKMRRHHVYHHWPLLYNFQLTVTQRQCYVCSSFYSAVSSHPADVSSTANTRLRTDSSKTSKQCTAFQTHDGWDHHTGPLEKPAGKSSQGSRGPASVQPGFTQLVLGIEHIEKRIKSL